MWIKRKSGVINANDRGYLISGPSYGVGVDEYTGGFFLWDGMGGWNPNIATIPTDSWHHLVVTFRRFNASMLTTFYIDGSSVNTVNPAQSSFTSTTMIGAEGCYSCS